MIMSKPLPFLQNQVLTPCHGLWGLPDLVPDCFFHLICFTSLLPLYTHTHTHTAHSSQREPLSYSDLASRSSHMLFPLPGLYSLPFCLTIPPLSPLTPLHPALSSGPSCSRVLPWFFPIVSLWHNVTYFALSLDLVHRMWLPDNLWCPMIMWTLWRTDVFFTVTDSQNLA